MSFQLDLLHSDRINVGYILTLLQLVVNSDDEQKRKQYEAQIHDLIGSEVGMHDKQELIRSSLRTTCLRWLMGRIFKLLCWVWDAEKEQVYQQLCEEENLKSEQMKVILDNYEFTKRLPRKEELKELPNFKVKLFERDNVFTNLLVKTRQFDWEVLCGVVIWVIIGSWYKKLDLLMSKVAVHLSPSPSYLSLLYKKTKRTISEQALLLI